MADPLILQTTCGRCHGDGQFPNPTTDFYGDIVEPEETIPCTGCDGTGLVPRGFILAAEVEKFEDLVDRVGDVLSTCNDTLEKCNEIYDKVK